MKPWYWRRSTDMQTWCGCCVRCRPIGASHLARRTTGRYVLLPDEATSVWCAAFASCPRHVESTLPATATCHCAQPAAMATSRSCGICASCLSAEASAAAMLSATAFSGRRLAAAWKLYDTCASYQCAGASTRRVRTAVRCCSLHVKATYRQYACCVTCRGPWCGAQTRSRDGRCGMRPTPRGRVSYSRDGGPRGRAVGGWGHHGGRRRCVCEATG